MSFSKALRAVKVLMVEPGGYNPDKALLSIGLSIFSVSPLHSSLLTP